MTQESSRLKGKIVLVTGAAQGMGRAQVEAMAREGATVYFTDIYVEQAEQAAKEVKESLGRTVHFLHADAASEADWERVLTLIVSAEGRIDGVVNNAGIGARRFGDVEDLETWRKYLEVNATSVYLGTSKSASLMQATGGGSIVNISSIMGIVGGPGHPGYYASKAAVRNYTKSAALKYGPAGIRVNSVHPGYMQVMRGSAAASAERREQIAQSVALRRTGEPNEVANGVLFLISDEASYITGTELVIDGGYLAQ